MRKQKLLTNFAKKAPSKILDRDLNTPLKLIPLQEIHSTETCREIDNLGISAKRSQKASSRMWVLRLKPQAT